MSLQNVVEILAENDGSLPDIDFYFIDEGKVAQAYALIQARATHLVSKDACYWSTSRQMDLPVVMGQNLAEMVVMGESPGSHIVYGGLTSNSGAPIPDLGVGVYDGTRISLDYRMGSDWNEAAIEGLFEIMSEWKNLSVNVLITHSANLFDFDDILITEFNLWYDAQSISDR